MGEVTRPSRDALIALALPIARQAAVAIQQIYKETVLAKNPQFILKSDQSPLTAADLAAHRIIEQGLRAATPTIEVVSEEGEQDHHQDPRRLEQADFWLVDPLDGTREFLSGNGEFTVNIAFIEAGRPTLGVVCLPVTGACYWGGAGLGAFLQFPHDDVPTPLAVNRAETSPWRVVASRSHLNEKTAALIKRLPEATLVQAGSSLKFCRIAQGQADIYPRLSPTCEWDTAAGQAVLEGAGGYVFDEQGQPLRYGKPEVLNPSFVACHRPYDEVAQWLR